MVDITGILDIFLRRIKLTEINLNIVVSNTLIDVRV